MNNERPDPYTMIGLHKLATQSGDGLVPELYELMSRRARMVEDNPNVAEFPVWQARPPARAVLGLARAAGDNILPFPVIAATTAKDQA